MSADATARLIAAQQDAVVESTVWSVPLHAVSAEVSDVPTAPRLIYKCEDDDDDDDDR